MKYKVIIVHFLLGYRTVQVQGKQSPMFIFILYQEEKGIGLPMTIYILKSIEKRGN